MIVVTDDQDAETLVDDLRSAGYEVAAAVDQEAAGRLATIRLLPRDPADQLVTDLLFASSGIESEIVAGVARDDDWAQAQIATGLIMERGFARDRDLLNALDELRHDGAY